MATKIRLQRHGRKRYPFYHIVVADARAPAMDVLWKK
jgi:small subunit ribosomal protein S16